MEAGSGARCAKPGGSELLRISARTLDRRCHRTVLHHLGQASLAGVDFRRRHLSMEKESDELLPLARQTPPGSIRESVTRRTERYSSQPNSEIWSSGPTVTLGQKARQPPELRGSQPPFTDGNARPESAGTITKSAIIIGRRQSAHHPDEHPPSRREDHCSSATPGRNPKLLSARRSVVNGVFEQIG